MDFFLDCVFCLKKAKNQSIHVDDLYLPVDLYEDHLAFFKIKICFCGNIHLLNINHFLFEKFKNHSIHIDDVSYPTILSKDQGSRFLNKIFCFRFLKCP